jgi:streptomycin 6-kinase
MRKYRDRWSLQLDGHLINGKIAMVQPVRTSAGTAAMLRLSPLILASAHDWLALSLWDGEGAVRMYEHDADDGAMLLERLDHSRNLDVLPIDQAVAVAGGLRARLSRLAPPRIRTLERQAEIWASELAAAPAVLPKPIKDEAIGICRELGPGSNGYLINEDLHYHNVLAGGREPWLVIDPMIVAGDREFGLSSLVWGRLEDSDTHRILNALIDIEQLDADRARAWTFASTVVKWTHATGRVARNCRTVARDLATLKPTGP